MKAKEKEHQLREVIAMIEKKQSEIDDLRKIRDQLKNPKNENYSKAMEERKKCRKQVLKNFLSGMSQKRAAIEAGMSPHNAPCHIKKAWRENFRPHYMQSRKPLGEIPYDKRPSDLRWLKDHPPLGWQNL